MRRLSRLSELHDRQCLNCFTFEGAFSRAPFKVLSQNKFNRIVPGHVLFSSLKPDGSRLSALSGLLGIALIQ